MISTDDNGISNAASKICELCSTNPAKYVCPRCGVPYCSLLCYKDEKKHLKCSESFYRDCVMEDLRDQQTNDPEAAKKMTETLQRFREQSDQQEDFIDDEEEFLDSDDDEPLEKRMDGINLDDADEIWTNLTEEEKNEFKKFVQDVNVQDVVPEWNPWWMVTPSTPKLVEELIENKCDTATQLNSSQRVKVCKEQPDIFHPIPPMSSLTKIRQNDHVKRGLANVIAAYAWTARLYNGEFVTYENLQEVAAALITLSSFLGIDTIFSTFEHALADVSLNACRHPELFDGGPALQAALNKDVFTILSGPQVHNPSAPNAKAMDEKAYVLSALSECYKVLCSVSKKSKSSTSSKSQDFQSNVSRIEDITDENPTSALMMSLSGDIKDSEEEKAKSFQKIFGASSSISIDHKALSKAKRKIHYLLAFANENDIL